jgi:competence CoiA-like predicted nuclease
MPFVALHKDSKERIVILNYENPRANLKSGDCICQMCEAPLIVRSGLIRRPHFAHYGDCKTDYRYHPESIEHLSCKHEVAETLKRTFKSYADTKIAYEYRIPEIMRVADIMITFPMGWRVVHEIQLSSITSRELEERTNDYLSAKIDIVWWLGRSANTPANLSWCLRNIGYVYCIFTNLAEGSKSIVSG